MRHIYRTPLARAIVAALSSRRRCLGMGLLRAKLESGEAGDGGGWWRVRALSAPRRVGGSVASG